MLIISCESVEYRVKFPSFLPSQNQNLISSNYSYFNHNSNTSTPHSTPQPLNPIKLNTLPGATFGRGSGRKVNFSECSQWLCRRVRVFWIGIQKNHLWLSPQLRCDPSLFLWLLYSLSRKTRHHELPRFWVLFSVGWLIERVCSYKVFSWVQWISWLLPRQFSPFYLHPSSKCATIRNINKVYPPLIKVWSRRLGRENVTTLGSPMFQVMSNVAHTESHRQSRYSGIDGLINLPSIHLYRITINNSPAEPKSLMGELFI